MSRTYKLVLVMAMLVLPSLSLADARDAACTVATGPLGSRALEDFDRLKTEAIDRNHGSVEVIALADGQAVWCRVAKVRPNTTTQVWSLICDRRNPDYDFVAFELSATLAALELGTVGKFIDDTTGDVSYFLTCGK
jgi:hypothetical protein